MERRTFFVKAGALFSMPLIITEIGCSDPYSDSSRDSNNNSGGSNTFPVTSSQASSSYESSHSHTVTISLTNVNNPPSNDITLNTSNEGHTHQIVLSMKDYEDLAAGNIIMENTIPDNNGHFHTFSIRVPKDNFYGYSVN